MDNMKFSVIIPTHNRNDFLRGAIESALKQSIAPEEIIVVDDVPSVTTRELVEEIDKSSGVKCIYIENINQKGALGSRNLAASHARGEYFAFLDDDDFWSNNYLEKVSEMISEVGVDVVVTGRMYWYSNEEKKIGKIPPEVYRKEDFYLRNPGVANSNLVVKRYAFLDVNGYDTGLMGGGDKDIFMRLMDKGYSYGVIKDPIMHKWKGHDDQWTTDSKRILRGVIRFYYKYFNEMRFKTHIRMLQKIGKLSIKAVLGR
jgi:glycosyltransferase involved in cell wall biosynthesis